MVARRQNHRVQRVHRAKHQEVQDAQSAKDTEKPHESDVQVITRAVYRANGNPTYVDNEHHTHIFTIRVPADAMDKPAPRQLTDGEFDEGGIAWAPDGSKIYFTSTRVSEPYYTEAGAELFSVPAAGGELTKVASIDGSIGGISVSPDGKRIAFVAALSGKPIRSYSQSDLWVTDATPGSTPKNLTATYDYDISGGIGGDQAAPRGQNRKPILWSADQLSLLVVARRKRQRQPETHHDRVRNIEPITDGLQDVIAYSATRIHRRSR